MNGPILATYTFTFDLTITDHNNVAIYFPVFDQVSPLVNLDLQYNPTTRPPSVSGRTAVDMCLYDGVGSQSQYLGVTVRDNSGRAPGPTGYSIWHEGGGTTDADRLDLAVSIAHNGGRLAMANGVEQLLRDIDSAQLRLVMLPGMSQPVFCVPTPLTLEIPRVDATAKRDGSFWGELKVELRLPTTRP